MRVIGGIAFVLIWWGAAIAWAVMSLMAGLMANDAGRVTADRHLQMIIWMVVGEVIVALAAVPGGLGIATGGHQTLLWGVFWALVLIGGGVQYRALSSFFADAAEAAK